MQRIINNMMAKNGVIKLEKETKFFGRIRESRGYYIVDSVNVRLYLHHDGIVKEGIKADNKKAAFWATKEGASNFFDKWCSEILDT